MHAFGQIERGGGLEPIDLAPFGALGDREVEIAVERCAVCHSDVHLVDGDWGEVARPLVPGHEIIGTIVDRGVHAEHAIGARVGLGWQAGACFACRACATGREHLCEGGKVRTCVGRPGGFAERVRCDARFCFALPAALDVATAAPLFCGGLTVFSPLERLGARTGVRVGVVGLGGLGHLAVQIARAMGASVVAFDPDAGKKDLARSLGASELVDAKGALPHGAVDLLLVTTHAALDWNAWMRVVDLEGTMCLVGVPGAPLAVSADPLLDEQKKITGSVIGSPETMRRLLEFAAAHRICPIVETMPMTRANEAIDRVRAGRARMRIVLEGLG